MKEGWIILSRKILDCFLWDSDEPFDMRSAWVDLLFLANHRDAEIVFDYKPMPIKRGQFLTSVRKLSKRWNWGVEKTLKFLRLLESLGMITRESNNRRTVITIVKYNDYQCDPNTGRIPTRTVSEQSPNANPTQTKNKKNEKNDKEYICAFETFWSIYPRKTDKSRAYQCYQARLRAGYSEDELLTACKNYADQCKKNGTEQRYIKQGSTFLGINEPFRDYLGEEHDGMGRTVRTNEDERNREIDETYARIQSGAADHDDDGLWD